MTTPIRRRARRDELDALVDSIIITPPPVVPAPSASFVETEPPRPSPEP